jgi:hypothetical protein
MLSLAIESMRLSVVRMNVILLSVVASFFAVKLATIEFLIAFLKNVL